MEGVYKSEECRVNLLLTRFDIRGIHICPCDSNPFSIRGPNGQEVPTTKLTISDIPFDVTDEEICNALSKLGINVTGGLKCEYSLDESGQLTRWKTGRRFGWIPVPSTPLRRNIRIGFYQARLFHKEQWISERKADKRCSRCLALGHFARECNNPIQCRTCHGEGHKMGDPACSLEKPGGQPGHEEIHDVVVELAHQPAVVMEPAVVQGDRKRDASPSGGRRSPVSGGGGVYRGGCWWWWRWRYEVPAYSNITRAA